MKKGTMKSLLILAGTFTLGASLCQAADVAPAAAAAGNAPITAPVGKKESTAKVACVGHQAGDAVTYTNRHGARIEAICRQVKGKLKAVAVK